MQANDREALIEAEASILSRFDLEHFNDLIDEPEVLRRIERKVKELVPSYTQLHQHQLVPLSQHLKNGSQLFKSLMMS